MPNVKINGGTYLSGRVKISGSKNAAIPLICASLLAKGKVLLRNVPRISDVDNLIRILKQLDCDIKFKGHTMLINNTNLKYKPLLFPECQKIRGSYYLVGIFLTLFSKCEIILPGGCKIGSRPIDIHLKAFEDMGYDCSVQENCLKVTKKLVLNEADITLKNKSVGASLNALFAGLSCPKFILRNGVFEPEGRDVISFLRQMGYCIQEENTSIYYEQKHLDFMFVKHEIIPDRMEAMTYVVAGLMNGNVVVENVRTKDMEYPLSVLADHGFDLQWNDTQIIARKSRGKEITFITDVYPGFPTDMQPLVGALCAVCETTSRITENIFENRFQIYKDLQDMGFHIEIEPPKVTLIGKPDTKSFELPVCDLRHGAALALLAITCKGISIITQFEYVERGYEDFIKKMSSLGVDIQME